MRLIDADALENEGWSLHRTYQKDKMTMVYEVKAISEINTAQPDVPGTNVGDTISRYAAIDWLKNEWDGMVTSVFDGIKNLPSTQPDWGKPAGNGRPLADSEIIPRLQDIKIQIGGSYAIDRAIEVLEGLSSAQLEPHWIPCSERLPERIIYGDAETVQEFFVTVKERWPGEEWSYHTDVAEFPGDYIDDNWDTYNDWKEGQDIHVIAWMPLPEPYNPDEFSQHMNPPEE